MILISDSAFNIAKTSNADIIGDRTCFSFRAEWNEKLENEPYEFFQGSFYFIKASAVKPIVNEFLLNKEQIIQDVCKLCFVTPDVIPPDVTMTMTAKRCNANIRFEPLLVKSESAVHLELTKDSKWNGFSKSINLHATGIHKTVKAII